MAEARYCIEPFSGGHLERCARLFVATFGAEPWNEPWTLETGSARLRELLGSPGFLGLVCLTGDEVLGFAAGCLWQHAWGRLYFLHEMCVEEGWRGRGVGGVLLGRLEEELAGKAVRVFLLTGRDSAAEAFYGGHGYLADEELVAMIKDL
jgi:GNAT superfamily N-acetyltransferase